MRHTKIIATVGPASCSDDILDALINAGTDIVRLNFSHGTHESHAVTFKRVRAAAERARREVAILQDLAGPKIRTGLNVDHRPIPIRAGETLKIATGDFAGQPGRLSTSFAGLAKNVRAGDRLLLADGLIELRVESTDGQEITTTVIDGGEIGEHKGINAGRRTSTSACAERRRRPEIRRGARRRSVAVGFVPGRKTRCARRMRWSGPSRNSVGCQLERPRAIRLLDRVLDVRRRDGSARRSGAQCRSNVPAPRRNHSPGAAPRRVAVIVATRVLES